LAEWCEISQRGSRDLSSFQSFKGPPIDRGLAPNIAVLANEYLGRQEALEKRQVFGHFQGSGGDLFKLQRVGGKVGKIKALVRVQNYVASLIVGKSCPSRDYTVQDATTEREVPVATLRITHNWQALPANMGAHALERSNEIAAGVSGYRRSIDSVLNKSQHLLDDCCIHGHACTTVVNLQSCCAAAGLDLHELWKDSSHLPMPAAETYDGTR
jgi:hypothetical protein